MLKLKVFVSFAKRLTLFPSTYCVRRPTLQLFSAVAMLAQGLRPPGTRLSPRQPMSGTGKKGKARGGSVQKTPKTMPQRVPMSEAVTPAPRSRISFTPQTAEPKDGGVEDVWTCRCSSSSRISGFTRKISGTTIGVTSPLRLAAWVSRRTRGATCCLCAVRWSQSTRVSPKPRQPVSSKTPRP